MPIPRSTPAQWVGTCGVRRQPLVNALKANILGHQVLHADETPVAVLKPGEGKTHCVSPCAGGSSTSKPWSTTSAKAALASTPGAFWTNGEPV